MNLREKEKRRSASEHKTSLFCINIQYHPSKKYLETAIQREIEIMKKVENENSVK